MAYTSRGTMRGVYGRITPKLLDKSERGPVIGGTFFGSSSFDVVDMLKGHEHTCDGRYLSLSTSWPTSTFVIYLGATRCRQN